MLGIAKVNQRIEAGDGFEDDITAFAPIAAVRPTILHQFFAAETDGAGAAPAGADKNLGLIKEMHGCPLTGFAGL